MSTYDSKGLERERREQRRLGRQAQIKTEAKVSLLVLRTGDAFFIKLKVKKKKERKGGIVYLLTTFLLISRKSEDTKNIHNILIKTISRKCQSWVTGAWLI